MTSLGKAPLIFNDETKPNPRHWAEGQQHKDCLALH